MKNNNLLVVFISSYSLFISCAAWDRVSQECFLGICYAGLRYVLVTTPDGKLLTKRKSKLTLESNQGIVQIKMVTKTLCILENEIEICLVH